MLGKLCNVIEYHHHSIFTVIWIQLNVLFHNWKLNFYTNKSKCFSLIIITHTFPCLNKTDKTSQVSSPISGVHTVTHLIKKAEHTCNGSCFHTDLSKMRMKDLRLTENKCVEIEMWFLAILKHALTTQERNESLIFRLSLKRKNT